MLKLLTIFISLAFGFEMPQNLSTSEQVKTLETLGFGTKASFLSQAYPLGGYSGFEVSLGLTAIDLNKVNALGNQPQNDSQLYFPSLTIGKGLYNQTDFFVHFSPPGHLQDTSQYGASLRWSFYEASYWPINLAVLVHGSKTNIKNKLSTKSFGADLMVGLTLSQYSFFLGGGYSNTAGRFIGGANGVTLSNATENQKTESAHIMVGGTYNFDPFFVGLAYDRFINTVITVKSGFLF